MRRLPGERPQFGLGGLDHCSKGVAETSTIRTARARSWGVPPPYTWGCSACPFPAETPSRTSTSPSSAFCTAPPASSPTVAAPPSFSSLALCSSLSTRCKYQSATRMIATAATERIADNNVIFLFLDLLCLVLRSERLGEDEWATTRAAETN